MDSRTFAQDVEFLKKHTDAVVLGGETGPAVVVVPQYQCRVMTSTVNRASGDGNGWINYELIESGKSQPHIMPYGGEERFWLGPEGGQFSVFFKKGNPFNLDAWQTPTLIDTEPFELVSKDETEVVCTRIAKMTNYSGFEFDLKIDRRVELMNAGQISSALKAHIPEEVQTVGYQTINEITNTGSQAWTKQTGALSIWLLGMFKHSPTTVVAIPFKTGDEAQLGPIVNDAYFGKVPPDRLKVEDGLIYFKGDGQYRSKIGVGPRRATDVLGSYDSARNLLTIVKYSLPEGVTDYVNSMWEIQENPFGGDVVNSYNDGPPEPGKKPLGPFYELETSSPAAFLQPNTSLIHLSWTVHFVGPREKLAPIAKSILDCDLDRVASVFK